MAIKSNQYVSPHNGSLIPKLSLLSFSEETAWEQGYHSRMSWKHSCWTGYFISLLALTLDCSLQQSWR